MSIRRESADITEINEDLLAAYQITSPKAKDKDKDSIPHWKQVSHFGNESWNEEVEDLRKGERPSGGDVFESKRWKVRLKLGQGKSHQSAKGDNLNKERYPTTRARSSIGFTSKRLRKSVDNQKYEEAKSRNMGSSIPHSSMHQMGHRSRNSSIIRSGGEAATATRNPASKVWDIRRSGWVDVQDKRVLASPLVPYFTFYQNKGDVNVFTNGGNSASYRTNTYSNSKRQQFSSISGGEICRTEHSPQEIDRSESIATALGRNTDSQTKCLLRQISELKKKVKNKDSLIDYLHLQNSKLERTVTKLKSLLQNHMENEGLTEDNVHITPSMVQDNQSPLKLREMFFEDTEGNKFFETPSTQIAHNIDIKSEIEKVQIDGKNKHEKRSARKDRFSKLEKMVMQYKGLVKDAVLEARQISNSKTKEEIRKNIIDEAIQRKNNESVSNFNISRTASMGSFKRSSPTKQRSIGETLTSYVFKLLDTITNMNSLIDIVCHLLKEVKEICPCNKITIYLTNEKVADIFNEEYKPEKHEVHTTRYLHDKTLLQVVFNSEAEFSEPKYESFEQLRMGKTGHKIIFKGIALPQSKQVIIGIQLERTKSGNMYTGAYFGFSYTDEIILNLICKFTGPKILELILNKKNNKQKEIRIHTIKVVTELLKEYTYNGLLKAYQDILPAYTGFGVVGAMVYNKKNDNFFTYSDAYMGGANKVISCPKTIGITGSVFRKQKAYFTNLGQREPRFNFDIDAVSTYANVKNALFLPIYGMNEKPLGVMQFINKSSSQPINESDIKKLAPLKSMFGLFVENLITMNTTINLALAIKNHVTALILRLKNSEFQESLENLFSINQIGHKLTSLNNIIDEKLVLKNNNYMEIFNEKIESLTEEGKAERNQAKKRKKAEGK